MSITKKIGRVFLTVTFGLAATGILGYAGARITAPAWATNEDDAVRVLEAQNLKPVKVGGYAWFQCGKDDTYATKFTALTQDGKTVEGAVCGGMFTKGSTLRF